MLHRQDAHPGGGQLDRERQPVQLAAQLVDLGLVGVGDREVGRDEPRPVAEQLNRLPLLKRRHWPGPLAFHAERLAAGGEDRQRGALGQQALDEGGDRAGQVLAVVKHDEHPLVARGARKRGVQMVGDSRRRVNPGVSGTPSPAATVGATSCGSSSGASSTQATSTAPADRGASRQRGGRRESQPRLPGATGAGEREQRLCPATLVIAASSRSRPTSGVSRTGSRPEVSAAIW